MNSHFLIEQQLTRQQNGIIAQASALIGDGFPDPRRLMQTLPSETSVLTADDLSALRRAKHSLESPALAMKLASVVGAPLEKLLARMPALANQKVNEATEA